MGALIPYITPNSIVFSRFLAALSRPWSATSPALQRSLTAPYCGAFLRLPGSEFVSSAGESIFAAFSFSAFSLLVTANEPLMAGDPG